MSYIAHHVGHSPLRRLSGHGLLSPGRPGLDQCSRLAQTDSSRTDGGRCHRRGRSRRRSRSSDRDECHASRHPRRSGHGDKDRFPSCARSRARACACARSPSGRFRRARSPTPQVDAAPARWREPGPPDAGGVEPDATGVKPDAAGAGLDAAGAELIFWHAHDPWNTVSTGSGAFTVLARAHGDAVSF